MQQTSMSALDCGMRGKKTPWGMLLQENNKLFEVVTNWVLHHNTQLLIIFLQVLSCFICYLITNSCKRQNKKGAEL